LRPQASNSRGALSAEVGFLVSALGKASRRGWGFWAGSVGALYLVTALLHQPRPELSALDETDLDRQPIHGTVSG
jgi:hypothetical protein